MENIHPDFIKYLLNKFEEKISDQEIFRVKIFEGKEKGIIVKLLGLIGYIGFDYMPWKYNEVRKWHTIMPYLINTFIYCRVHYFSKEPPQIILNADFPQFKNFDFIVDEVYNAVILKVFDHGLQIELGYHFNWKNGSHLSYIDRSVLNDPYLIRQFNKGEILEVICEGFDENEKPVFVPSFEPELDVNIALKRLVNTVVDVEIIIEEDGKIDYLIEKRFSGIMPITSVLYPNKITKIKKWVNKFTNGDKIRGRVLSVNYSNKIVVFQWVEIDDYIKDYDKSHLRTTYDYRTESYVKSFFRLKDAIQPGTTEKIQILFTIVDVLVIKNTNPEPKKINDYTVNNVYKADLTIINPNYHITIKEKETIEKNLQNGEKIKCKVISLEFDGTLVVQWQIPDDELKRFLEV